MKSPNIRRSLVRRAMTVSIGSLHVFIASDAAQAQPQAQAQAPKIDCALARDIASRAYDRAFAAVKDGKAERAIANKESFWDIEEFSRHCPSVRMLAKTLTDNGLGKEVGFPSLSPSKGSASLGSSTASSSGQNSIVAAIEAIPRKNSDSGAGSTTGASVGSSSSGFSGSSGSSGNTISSATDVAYRVTLRMADGTTRIIIQQTTPSFRVGDPVNLNGQVIEH
jgi:hypothetical protein